MITPSTWKRLGFVQLWLSGALFGLLVAASVTALVQGWRIPAAMFLWPGLIAMFVVLGVSNIDRGYSSHLKG
jgi:hypothetical protein